MVRQVLLLRNPWVSPLPIERVIETGSSKLNHDVINEKSYCSSFDLTSSNISTSTFVKQILGELFVCSVPVETSQTFCSDAVYCNGSMAWYQTQVNRVEL